MEVRGRFSFGCMALFLVACWGRCVAADLAMRELFPAKALLAPPVEEELARDVLRRTWDLSAADRANFTALGKGVRQLAFTPDKSLRFECGEADVCLDWGNYNGKQPLDQRVFLWPWANTVKLRVRQSVDQASVWKVAFSADGTKVDVRNSGSVEADSVAATLKGTDWQTLEFSTLRGPGSLAGIVPDAFRITIQAKPGTELEIASLQIARNVHQGCFRKEIVLPEGKVWRAVADAGFRVQLFINGRSVPLDNPLFQRPEPPDLAGPQVRGPYGGTVPLDLTPCFKPGRNCVGIQAWQAGGTDHLILQGQIVMESGEVIPIQSDETWRYSAEASEGWSEPGFDDRNWTPAETSDFKNGNRYGRYTFHGSFLVSSYLLGQGGSWMGPVIPEYSGRIVLENPADSKLFFDAARPIIIRARLPRGLAACNPRLAWRFYAANPDGTLPDKPAVEGVATKFEKSGGSLIAELPCGALSRGVYALDVQLHNGQGKILEDRIREPIVVLGKIETTETAGVDLRDGLDLELEDTIDCTDPNDPHPWLETSGGDKDVDKPAATVTQPRIVRRGGLVYRETSPLLKHQRAGGVPLISYRIQLRDPESWYLFAMEYPNDDHRWIGAQVSTAIPNVHNNVRSGVGVWTGDKWPLTGRMQELTWIVRSGPYPHTLEIMPLWTGHTAAVSKVRIYRIKNRTLPALAARNQRRIGVYSERTTRYTGFGATFGPEHMVSSTMPVGGPESEFRPIPERLRYLSQCLASCERYAEYLRFTGQNLHVMGCVQYADNNTPYTPHASLFGSRVPRDLRQMLIRVLGRNGIDVYAAIEYNAHKAFAAESPWNDGQVQRGADTATLVDRDGKQPPARDGGRDYGSGWNPLHPRYEERMVNLGRDVARTFADQPNFRGICWTTYLTGEWGPGLGGMFWWQKPDPFRFSYDDATVARFEADTRIDVPGDAGDPQRFAERQAFLTSDAMLPKWRDWRCRRIRDAFLRMRDATVAARDDLELVLALYFDNRHAIDWATTSKTPEEYFRDWGFDLSLYQGQPNLRLSRWLNAILHGDVANGRSGYAAGWTQMAGPQFVELYDRFADPALMVMHQWLEIMMRMPGAVFKGDRFEFAEPTDWPSPGTRGRLFVQPNADNAREMFTVGLIGADPQTLMYGFTDVNMMVGHEQELRRFAQVYQALPRLKFEPALGTSVRTNLAIRHARHSDGYYFYVANPGYWPIEGSVEARGAQRIVNLVTGKEAESRRTTDGLSLPVLLQGFDVAAFRIEGDSAEVAGWKCQDVAEEHLAHLRGILQRTDAGMKARGQGGFKPADWELLRTTMASAEASLGQKQYAQAWYLLTDHRFWNLYVERFRLGEKP